ncbi:MAG TPA: VWA domain-containing protein [Bryobacteraceae bacterium]|nr:VWA domain-containing protein [Bryobacteraceae bacterium]
MRRGAALLAFAAIAWAQQSDEVRVSAHTYAPPQLHLTAQTELVQLEVVVRDPKGHARAGLKQGDFAVLDEGKPSPIVAFSLETRLAMEAVAPPAVTEKSSTPAPVIPVPSKPATAPVRSTLIYFDDLHGTQAELQRTQAAARQFIRQGMGPGARAAVFSASKGLTLDFTADGEALTQAVGKLHAHQRFSDNGLATCPRITPYQAFLIVSGMSPDALQAAYDDARTCGMSSSQSQGSPRNPSLNSASNMSGTVLEVKQQAQATWEQSRGDSLNAFDALGDALNVLSRAPGTRVLLMVSTGFLSGMMDGERSSVIDRAIHAGIVIDAMDAKGLWSEGPARDFDQRQNVPVTTFIFETSTIGARNDAVDEVMEEFASGTGGLFFHNNNDLVGGFAELASVPETIYLLGIQPDTGGSAGRYHKLKVRLTSKSNDYLQTRPGYFASGKAASTPTATAGRPIDDRLLASDVEAEIPIGFTAQPAKGPNGESLVSTVIHVELAPLAFTERDGRHLQKITFIEALFDSGGKLVSAKEGSMDLALKDDTLKRLEASGISGSLKLAAPPGTYQVRVVVQDADGKIATQNQTVDVPK